MLSYNLFFTGQMCAMLTGKVGRLGSDWVCQYTFNVVKSSSLCVIIISTLWHHHHYYLDPPSPIVCVFYLFAWCYVMMAQGSLTCLQ